MPWIRPLADTALEKEKPAGIGGNQRAELGSETGLTEPDSDNGYREIDAVV